MPKLSDDSQKLLSGYIDRTQRKAEKYENRYKTWMQYLHKSPLAHAKRHGLDEWDIVAVGQQMDAFVRHCRMMETNGNLGDLGPLPKIGLDVIAASFGISPLPLICGIQPIDDTIGLVWYEDWQSENTRGNVTPGQNFISTLQAPDVFPIGYAKDTRFNKSLVASSNGNQTYTALPLGGSDEFSSPINPGLVTMFASAIFNSGADAVTFAPMTPDRNTGKFGDYQVVNTNGYGISGNVDFADGTVTFKFSADPSGQTNVSTSFATLEEAGSDLQRTQLVLQAIQVQAEFYALKSTYGFAQEYMMQKRWGMSAQAKMSKTLSMMVNNEVFNTVLDKLLNAVPNNANIDWGREPGSGVDLYTHTLTLPFAMIDAAAIIQENAGRGEVNAWIVGRKAGAVMENVPGFTKTFDNKTLGAHVFGTFKGDPVIKVPADSQMDPNLMVGICKGDTPFENAATWSPYMPLTMTEVTGTGANPLQKQQAAATWGAATVTIPNFLCSVTVDQTNFDYGSQQPSS